jgi:hypothetical protein
VSGSGKLGVVMSSARFKRDIHDMRDSSEALMKLRPVTFRYRNDPDGIKQYGLVAEEVARIYPELVGYGADGKVETVRYLTLTAMLLNELQKQTRLNERQAELLRRQTGWSRELSLEVARQRQELSAQRAAFEQRLSALERTMRAQDRNRNLAAAFDR